MTVAKKPLGLTELVLRDAHQSLFAIRMRLDDMHCRRRCRRCRPGAPYPGLIMTSALPSEQAASSLFEVRDKGSIHIQGLNCAGRAPWT